MPPETLYRPKGAGHSAPEGERRHTKLKDELVEAFEKWLDMESRYLGHKFNIFDAYHMAESILSYMPGKEDMTPQEIGGLPLPFQDHPAVIEAGIFLSAAYNMLGDGVQNVVFDNATDTELNHMGMYLNPNVLLLLRGDFGTGTGYNSYGGIISYGNIRGGLGSDSKGVIVNMGEAEDLAYGSRCVAINFGKSKRFGFGFRWFLNYGEIEKYQASDTCNHVIVREPGKMELDERTQRLYSGKVIEKTNVILPEQCARSPELIARLDEIKGNLDPSLPDEKVFEQLLWLRANWSVIDGDVLDMRFLTLIENEVQHYLEEAGVVEKRRRLGDDI